MSSDLVHFALMQKRTKKSRLYFFNGQIESYFLKEINSLRSDSISFHGNFAYLTLAVKIMSLLNSGLLSIGFLKKTELTNY